MKVLALNPSRQIISLDEFFSSEPEFMENRELFFSVIRKIKTVLRHLDEVDYLAKKSGSTYILDFEGITRTYKLSFEIKDDLFLTALN